VRYLFVNTLALCLKANKGRLEDEWVNGSRHDLPFNLEFRFEEALYSGPSPTRGAAGGQRGGQGWPL
jgi:hypothetical protein